MDHFTQPDNAQTKSPTETLFEKPNHKREHSPSSEDSLHQRKRLKEEPPTGQDPFKRLPRDVRNMIYEYMTFPPRENKGDVADGRSARNLALTCQQAKAEYDEERQRRFWIHLKKIEHSHLTETGYRMTFPRELESKDDLSDVRSLKAIIHGPFPGTEDELPQSYNDLQALSLDELVFHYTGAPFEGPSQEEVRMLAHRLTQGVTSDSQKHLTLSWNRAEQKQNTTLTGHMIKVITKTKSHLFKPRYFVVEVSARVMLKLAEGENMCWPSIEIANNEDLTVGFVRVARGSHHRPTDRMWTLLMSVFSMMDVSFVSGLSFVEAYRIEAEYEVGEDE